MSGEVTVRLSAAGASGPVSDSVTVVARLSALASPWAWSAFRPPSASGNSQLSSRPGPAERGLHARPAGRGRRTPLPLQYGMPCAGVLSEGWLASGSWVQKVRAGLPLRDDRGDGQRDRAGRDAQRHPAAGVQPEPRGGLRW